VVDAVNHDYSALGPFAAMKYEYISRAKPRQHAPGRLLPRIAIRQRGAVDCAAEASLFSAVIDIG
jgi:hypothetical protein